MYKFEYFIFSSKTMSPTVKKSLTDKIFKKLIKHDKQRRDQEQFMQDHQHLLKKTEKGKKQEAESHKSNEQISDRETKKGSGECLYYWNLTYILVREAIC